MSDDIVVTPSFPKKLEKEGACLTTKQMPFVSHVIAWLVLFGGIVLSFQIVDRIAPQQFGTPHLVAVSLGAASYMLFSLTLGTLMNRHNWAIQRAAREKSTPFSFRFGADGFGIDARNSKTDYEWDAVDEVAVLTGGTGVRVGVFVYPVAEADLPESMTSEVFRAQLETWRAA
ncbi:MAG: hypothetical protein HKP54_14900 [Boseongicola sp.]|nr:hypothetical protein [Boseongicola sp.]